MTRRPYRSDAARAQVRHWCERRLAGCDVPHRRTILDTRLGATHLLDAGHAATTVLYLPGTNSDAATGLPLLGAPAAGHRVVAADVPGQPGLAAGDRQGRRPAGRPRRLGR